jgi:excisionase family DNA binding protein
MIRRIIGPPVLTRAEAAQLLGVHPSTVARWAVAGLLPCVRTPSGQRRYRSQDVEELLNKRLKGQPGPMAERAGQVRSRPDP